MTLCHTGSLYLENQLSSIWVSGTWIILDGYDQKITTHVVSIVTTLRAWRPRNLDSIPSRERDISFLQSDQTGSQAQPASYLLVTGSLGLVGKADQLTSI
jgi:hypothetical protein